MGPPITQSGKPAGQEHKSWKKINEERKLFRREQRQDRLIREVENAEKLKALAKENAESNALAAKKQNPSTVSIAVPGSILENAQSPELRSYLAGQIARAACIFRVNEIIIFDDIGVTTARDTKVVLDDETNDADGEGVARTVRASTLQLARILQYLECPQYLRKFFFPLHKDLKYSGILNPLDTPHHLRQQSVFLYREGIVTERQAKEGRCFVNVGLLNDVLVDKAIKPGVRVTVKLINPSESKKIRGKVVSPEEPRRETGVYWGYNVRIAHSLAEIFTKSPYKGGYDITIGTSDRGSNVQEVEKAAYAFNHLLIVFGGLSGLETALTNDEELNVEDPALLFDHYLNVLPKQGSRTIRTEEALLIALAALQEKLNPHVADIEDTKHKELLPRSEDTGIKPVFESKKTNSNANNPFARPKRHGEVETEDGANEETVYTNPFISGNPNESKIKAFEQNNKASNSRHSNPFQQNGNNNPRKQKFRDDNATTNRDSNDSANKFNKKPNEVKSVPVQNDDLEVVPASSETPLKKKKKVKKDDVDLSRFD